MTMSWMRMDIRVVPADKAREEREGWLTLVPVNGDEPTPLCRVSEGWDEARKLVRGLYADYRTWNVRYGRSSRESNWRTIWVVK